MAIDVKKRKPDWLKVKIPKGSRYLTIDKYHLESGLHTVCRSAACPNRGECWSKGTATFLILGNQCTRSCQFCNIEKNEEPSLPDSLEPNKIATAIAELKLNFAVITSVTRDDLVDGGAGHFCATLRAIRQQAPDCKVELLIPDFNGNTDALDLVLNERPDVLSHNMETVPRLYKAARGGADFSRSLNILNRAAKSQHRIPIKSGIMLGLGEEPSEVTDALGQIVDQGCSFLTIGQYLAPSKLHLPVREYLSPEIFETYRQTALQLGFSYVESGPLVRSSYLAEQQFDSYLVARGMS